MCVCVSFLVLDRSYRVILNNIFRVPLERTIFSFLKIINGRFLCQRYPDFRLAAFLFKMIGMDVDSYCGGEGKKTGRYPRRR